MKGGGKSARGATGRTSRQVKKMPPEAEVRSLGQQFRGHQAKPGNCRHQDEDARDSISKRGHDQLKRNPRPSASGSLLSAIKTISSTFQMPQPPSVKSLIMPSPVWPR